jgi:hypothetical protein
MFSCAKPKGQDASLRMALLVSSLLATVLCCCGICVRRVSADEGGAPKGQLVSAGDRSSAAHLNKLIDQLGDELFAVREEATNQLIRAGIEAKPLLLAALSSSDAEVRFRAKRVLEVVVEGDFQRRLKAFAEDVDGSRKLSMPGWKVFKELVGASRTARALFVEIQQAEPLLLEAYDTDPAVAAQSLAERSKTLQLNANGRIINRVNRNVLVSGMQVAPSLGSALAMLLVGGDEKVALNGDVADRFRTVLNNNEMYTVLQAGDDRSQMCRKILGRWIRRDVGENITLINLQIAMRYNLPDALEPAVNTLKRGNVQKLLRHNALLIVGNYGGKEHLPLVEPLLKDTDVIYTTTNARVAVAQVPNPNQVLNTRVAAETQVRDVALAVTIKLSEQDPKKFGFELLKLGDQKRLQQESSQSRMGFRSEEDRLAAFKKWDEWRKDQQQAAIEKPKSDTIER